MESYRRYVYIFCAHTSSSFSSWISEKKLKIHWKFVRWFQKYIIKMLCHPKIIIPWPFKLNKYDMCIYNIHRKYISFSLTKWNFLWSQNERKMINTFIISFNLNGKRKLFLWVQDYFRLFPLDFLFKWRIFSLHT